MPEEKIDLVVRLDRGNDVKEDKEFNNVSSSWAEIDSLVLEKDNTPEFWIIKKAYPAIRADKLVKIIEFRKKNNPSESFFFIFGILLFMLVLIFLFILSNAPVWLLGLTGKNFFYIWSIGIVFIIFLKPNPNIESIPIYFVFAAALLYVPIAFYQFFLEELGGINLMLSVAGVGEEPVPTNQEIGEYLVQRGGALSTALVSWIPAVSAFLLLLGRTNLSKAVNEFKPKS